MVRLPLSTSETKPTAGKAAYAKYAVGGVVLIVLGTLAVFGVKQHWRTIEQNASKDNLTQLAKALKDYNDENKHLPGQLLDPKTEQPLLSWRVLLLPFLGEKELYEQIRLDEAWDSAHNRQFWNRMPAVYQLPGKPSDGMTYYQVFHGDRALFGNDKRHIGGRLYNCPRYKLQTIPDGSSATIFAVEAAEAVNWMKTQDIPFERRPEGTSWALLGDHWGDGTCRVVLCDGSVVPINRQTVSPIKLQEAIDPADGPPPIGDWQ